MGRNAPTSQADLEELGRRADAAYDRYVKPQLTPADTGKFVALDVDTGVYEVDIDDLAALHRLLDHQPDASSWLYRVGSAYVDRLGWSAGTREAI